MTLLSIVQSVAQKVLGNTPTAAVSNADTNIQQIIAAVNEEGEELAERYGWQALTKEATFTTLNTTVQGTISALTGPDFSYVKNETMWDRTQRRPVFGPRDAAEWQQLQAQFVQGPWWQYRIRGNQLMFTPSPPAGDAIYFEWMSKWWAIPAAGTAPTQDTMQADTDTSILHERLIKLGALWRFKQFKELDYAEDFDKHDAAITEAMGRDASKPILSLNGPKGNIQPGVFVAAGSWGGNY